MFNTGLVWTTTQNEIETEANIRLESTPSLVPYADVLIRNADESDPDYFLWICDASDAELIAMGQDLQAAELADALADEAEREYALAGYGGYAQNDTEAWIEDMDYTNEGSDDYDNSDDDHYGEDNYGFDYDYEQEYYD